MESSKKITTIFMVVALLAMAALAFWTNRQDDTTQIVSPLPGLAENLAALEKITDFPHTHVRSVRITRTNGEELELIRETPVNGSFEYRAETPESIAPYSAILYANAAFLDGLNSSEEFAVTGFVDENVIGRLTYTSFDGLVLESVVFRAQESTWLRFIAANSEKLAQRYAEISWPGRYAMNEITDIARRLDGRVYRRNDD